jgi:hypothetical protein
MSQVLLVQRSDITDYRSLSANLNVEKKLNPFILAAQNMDLKGLIGNAFLNALVKDFSGSPSLATYSDLFNGSEWTCSGKQYKHHGLKSVLSLFSYARYVIDSNSESTAFGTQEKKNEYSDQIEWRKLTAMQENAEQEALAYWEDVKQFLNDNSSSYPLWYCGLVSKNTRISAVDNIKGRKYGRHI